MKLLKGFSDAELIEGGASAERQAQEELRRQQRVRVAMTSGRPELPRSDLAPAHVGFLEDTPTGDYFAVSRADQSGEKHEPTFDAFYIDPTGDVVYLQRPASGAKSRAELEQQQADREQRRNQPQPRPAWLTAKR